MNTLTDQEIAQLIRAGEIRGWKKGALTVVIIMGISFVVFCKVLWLGL